VILSSSDKYVLDKEWDNPSGSLTPEQWGQALAAALHRFSGADIDVALFRDVPRWRDVAPTKCMASLMGRSFSHLCATRRQDAFNSGALRSENAALAEVPSAGLIDLTSSFCTATMCAPESGGILEYRDREHLTARFAASLAPILGRKIDSLGALRGLR
jgi:hypothetical protein